MRTPVRSDRRTLRGTARTAAGLVAACAFVFCAAPARAEVGPKEVQDAIAKGREVLLSRLSSRIPGHNMELGATCLSTMALINVGVPLDHPKIVAAMKTIVAQAPQMRRDDYHDIYTAGLVNMVLAMTGDAKYESLAKAMVRRLESSQSFQRYRYWGDYSRTQFAILGLKAAEDLGVAVAAKTYEDARKGVEQGQNPDGGWTYHHHAGRGSYGSMTAAGVASLFICGARLFTSTRTCGVGQEDTRLASGLAWLEKNFSARGNPGAGIGNVYYYLYALERVGVLTACRTIGGHDWYREGAEFLVESQQDNGMWNNNDWDTAFALLFLGKGSAPVCVQKLLYDKNWSPDPYDAKNLVAELSRDVKLPMSWQVVEPGAPIEQFAVAPVLYMQGHDAFALSPELRQKIRAFVDNGGFLYAAACCGSEAFDTAFRAEMRRMFPDSEMIKLTPDHPVYTALKPVTQREAQMLEGIEVGCRTGVIYSPRDLCCVWGSCKGCADRTRLNDETAWSLGKNMLVYALSYQRLRDKLEKVKVISTAQRPERKRGVVWIGQIYHTGEFNPDPGAVPNMADTLQKKLSFPAEVRKARVVPGQDDLFEYPILYITGHKEFAFDKEPMRALKEYLEKGGYLIAEACCGRPQFDAAFRKFVKELFPDAPLVRLPPTHPVFQSPYRVDKVEYKPAAERAFPDLGGQPVLEGIQLQGRLAVVYSRFNMSCELQPHPCATCLGLKQDSAFRMSVNLLVYGFRE